MNAMNPRERMYANWIGLLAVFAGAMTTGTVLFLFGQAPGATHSVVGPAAVAIGQLTAGLAAYPWMADTRRRHSLRNIGFGAYAVVMSAAAAVLFVGLCTLGA